MNEKPRNSSDCVSMRLLEKAPLEADVRRRQKFIRIVSWVCLLVTAVFLPLPAYFGVGLLYIPIGLICLALSAGLYLNARGYVSLVGNIMPFFLSVLLFCVTFLQGMDTGTYLYFIPLLVAIPFFIDHRDRGQLVFHMAHPTVFMLILTLSEGYSLVPELTAGDPDISFKIGLVVVVFLCQFAPAERGADQDQPGARPVRL
ncbi:MAG: hypothetical protein MUD08_18100 [Cytophagales bacterium]|nr:hypothetical protein [Cytophagales bacterium]